MEKAIRVDLSVILCFLLLSSFLLPCVMAGFPSSTSVTVGGACGGSSCDSGGGGGCGSSGTGCGSGGSCATTGSSGSSGCGSPLNPSSGSRGSSSGSCSSSTVSSGGCGGGGSSGCGLRVSGSARARGCEPGANSGCSSAATGCGPPASGSSSSETEGAGSEPSSIETESANFDVGVQGVYSYVVAGFDESVGISVEESFAGCGDSASSSSYGYGIQGESSVSSGLLGDTLAGVDPCRCGGVGCACVATVEFDYNQASDPFTSWVGKTEEKSVDSVNDTYARSGPRPEVANKLRPVFNGTSGAMEYEVHLTPKDVDKTYYVDITYDKNAPSIWTWEDVQALDIRLFEAGGENTGSLEAIDLPSLPVLTNITKVEIGVEGFYEKVAKGKYETKIDQFRVKVTYMPCGGTVVDACDCGGSGCGCPAENDCAAFPVNNCMPCYGVLISCHCGGAGCLCNINAPYCSYVPPGIIVDFFCMGYLVPDTCDCSFNECLCGYESDCSSFPVDNYAPCNRVWELDRCGCDGKNCGCGSEIDCINGVNDYMPCRGSIIDSCDCGAKDCSVFACSFELDCADYAINDYMPCGGKSVCWCPDDHACGCDDFGPFCPRGPGPPCGAYYYEDWCECIGWLSGGDCQCGYEEDCSLYYTIDYVPCEDKTKEDWCGPLGCGSFRCDCGYQLDCTNGIDNWMPCNRGIYPPCECSGLDCLCRTENYCINGPGPPCSGVKKKTCGCNGEGCNTSVCPQSNLCAYSMTEYTPPCSGTRPCACGGNGCQCTPGCKNAHTEEKYEPCGGAHQCLGCGGANCDCDDGVAIPPGWCIAAIPCGQKAEKSCECNPPSSDCVCSPPACNAYTGEYKPCSGGTSTDPCACGGSSCSCGSETDCSNGVDDFMPCGGLHLGTCPGPASLAYEHNPNPTASWTSSDIIIATCYMGLLSVFLGALVLRPIYRHEKTQKKEKKSPVIRAIAKPNQSRKQLHSK